MLSWKYGAFLARMSLTQHSNLAKVAVCPASGPLGGSVELVNSFIVEIAGPTTGFTAYLLQECLLSTLPQEL